MTENHTADCLLSSHPATADWLFRSGSRKSSPADVWTWTLAIPGQHWLSCPCRRVRVIHLHRFSWEAERHTSETSLIYLWPVQRRRRTSGNNCILSYFPQHADTKSRFRSAACAHTSGSHRKQIKLSLLCFSYQRYFCNSALWGVRVSSWTTVCGWRGGDECGPGLVFPNVGNNWIV